MLDDARRAMSERRHEELRRSLDFIRELVTYAMDEIRAADIQWSAPGSQPGWPPLRELSRNLYSLREDIIREGDREYILELLRFDDMLTYKGIRQRCGELFTVGLNAYRLNYQIANRIGGGEFRDEFRNRFSQNADSFMFGVEPREAFPYAKEMVKHQERLLSDAMHSGQSSDYDQLHRGFQAKLNAIRLRWETNGPFSQGSELYEKLEQEYRIALMGLGGRAIFLAQDRKISDPDPYLEIGRLTYSSHRTMADDLAQALLYDDLPGFSLWQEWETEDAQSYEAIIILPERYPLLFFALRLVELSSDTMPAIDLRGRAQQVLDWFINNSESVGAYARAEVDPTLKQRRELAAEALRSAIHRDELAEDYEIIGREISETRVSDFKSDVYAATFSSNIVKKLFARAGASLNLSGDATDIPEERVIQWLEHKGFFTETPEAALIIYGSLDGDQPGRALSNDALQRFCEALEGAPDMRTPLDTPAELLQGIDQAIEGLGAPERVIIVLAGNWSELQFALDMANPEEYEASWRLPESERIGEVGRYRGHSIINAPDYEDRCVYVVDPSGWGRFVRAKTDGDKYLRVEVKPIPIERARELLAANSNHFASEPDEESKLRKLQACVEIAVGARTGFRISDPTRARRVAPVHQPVVANEASKA